jgi:hypothetical protein
MLGPLKKISFVHKKCKRGVKEFFIMGNLYFILGHPVIGCQCQMELHLVNVFRYLENVLHVQ